MKAAWSNSSANAYTLSLSIAALRKAPTILTNIILIIDKRSSLTLWVIGDEEKKFIMLKPGLNSLTLSL
jgi:hypothetical protein